MVDAVAGELPRASVGEDKVTLDASVDDLDDDLLVGEANDQAVLGGVAASQSSDLDFITNMTGYVLLVLRLRDQPLAGVVCVTVSCRLGQTLQSLLTISLALSPATVLDLEAREVRIRLDLFDERHLQVKGE